jgi:SAM-dependent methyltransferase
MTLLTIFHDWRDRVRFIEGVMRHAGDNVLDVGCATGSVCGLLRERGARAVGIDINPRFIAAARAKDPTGEYHVGDMRNFRFRQRFDLLICVGTTFAYNLTNRDILRTLLNFRAHLKPAGRVIVDVLNAIAFIGPRPFQIQTKHKFVRNDLHATATIRHGLDFKAQSMTEQVSWKIRGERRRRDPEERQRLFFPQELTFYLKMAGFDAVKLMDGYRRTSKDFSGRRLIAVAEKGT